MRVEITYYADDGEEFSTEEACLEYENRLKTDMGSVIFFDQDCNVMKDPVVTDIEQSAYYMKVLDAEKATRLIDWLSYQISFSFLPDTPIKNHYYRWVEDVRQDGWKDFTEEFEVLKKMLAKLMTEFDKDVRNGK